MKPIISGMLLVLYSNLCFSQLKEHNPPLTKLSILQDAVNHTELIIEVHKMNCKSFKTKNGMYTSCTYKVLKVLKGNLTDSLIEMIYDGGTVDGESVSSTESPQIIENEGILCLIKKSDLGLNKDLSAYLLDYGFCIVYDKGTHHVHCSNIVFDDIEKDLYEPIEVLTGQKRKVLGLNIFEIEAMKKK